MADPDQFQGGGQNESIGKDPVFFNRVDTLLPHLYAGGYSAVIDASKVVTWFYILAVLAL
jgi:hypothetical protein